MTYSNLRIHWQRENVLQEVGVQQAELASTERFYAPVKRSGQGQFIFLNMIFKSNIVRKLFYGRL